MVNSQGTLVQRWNKSCTITVALFLIILHVTAFGVAVYLCPELFTAKSYQGVHCQPNGEGFSIDNVNTNCDEYNDEDEIREGDFNNGACLKRDSGDVVNLRDIRISFTFPANDLKDQLTVWNWRLVGSLALHLSIMDSDLGMNETEFQQQVMMSASIDYALSSDLPDDNIQKPLGCISSSPWHSKAIVHNVERTMECGMVKKFLNSKADIDVSCSLHPFFELFVLSNSSYIVQVRLQEEAGGHSILNSNATISSYLTLARETDDYHKTYFYVKCLFSPLVVMALVWFMVRLCLNDLYVTIHDRLLITASLAQVKKLNYSHILSRKFSMLKGNLFSIMLTLFRLSTIYLQKS